MATARRTGTGRTRGPVAPAYPAGTNTFSAVPVPAAPSRAPKLTPVTENEKATARAGRAQQRQLTAKRGEFDAAGGRPLRADVAPATPVGHGMTLHDFSAQGMLGQGVSGAHVLDAVRGTSMMADPRRAGTATAGSGEKLARTVVQGTPNINEPHDVLPNTVAARRWEDLHPHEQERALRRVAQHGSSPEQMHADLTSQVLSAHARSGRNGVSTPFSSLFYEGPSQQHSKIEQGADELMAHPAFQRTGLGREHARAMVSVANANTSPNVKFQQGEKYPNHEVAMTVLHHVLGGGTPDDVPTPAEMGQAAYPANIRKAAVHAQQMLGGAQLHQLRAEDGRPAFDPGSAPKVTDYASAWTAPTGPDSRYVSDVHSTHSLMPHLGTAKPVMHQHADGSTQMIVPGEKVPRGYKPVVTEKVDKKTGKTVKKYKTGKSETEQYLAGDKVGLSALHDHIARRVATDLGLSHDVNNAGATHYLQATDWGEEQINRKDITDRTEALAYGGDARVPHPTHDIAVHTPAGGRVVGTPTSRRTVHFGYGGAGDPTEGMGGGERDKLERGIAARSAATTRKRPVRPAGDDKFDDDDPWAPRNQR